MHISVFKKEVLDIFNPKPGQNYIDCTFGQGGHSFAILEKIAPNGKIFAFDLSKNQIDKIEKVKKYIKDKRLIIVNNNFKDLEKVVRIKKIKNINGILFDLGFSSWHLDYSGRGFSFLKDEPLDMRYDLENQKLTAIEIVNSWPADIICKIIKDYGGERYARFIANKIKEERKKKSIYRTQDLVEVIGMAVAGFYKKQKIHYATRTFQALRIAVNDELENLKLVLPQALNILEKGGIIIIISFHSLEDKIIKNYFREQNKGGSVKLLFKKPLVPTSEEINRNIRARSAKLRAVSKE